MTVVAPQTTLDSIHIHKPSATYNWHSLGLQKSLSDFEKGFLAGMLEGEGYLGITKSRKKSLSRGWQFTVRITIANTNKELLEKCRSMLNGLGVVGVSRKNTYKTRVSRNWAVCYTLAVYRYRDIEKLLQQLLPHLVSKRKKAELLLEFIKLRKQARRITLQSMDNGRIVGQRGSGYSQRELKIYSELRELNSGGKKN